MYDLTDQMQRIETITWAKKIRELLAKEGQQSAVDAVNDAITQFEADKVTIAVLGKAKRGKSTLINALLGRTDDVVAPIDVLPASSTISRFFSGPQEVATVHIAKEGKDDAKSIPFASIREYVTEECNPENRKGVTFVDISAPFSTLDPNVVLVDTPGAGSMHEHHDALLHAFIPSADAVIFLVTAQMPIDQLELELLGKIRAADIKKIFFVVNQIDATTPQDLSDAIEHNAKVLASVGIHTSITHKISARAAFEGKPGNGGLDSLVTEIREFLSVNRLTAQVDRLRSRVENIALPLLTQLDIKLREGLCSSTELDAQISQISESRKEMERQRVIVDREFLLEWNSAIDYFEQQLGKIQRQTQDHFEQKIAATSKFNIDTMKAQLPGLIRSDIDARIRPPIEELEQRLDACAQQLQRSLPYLDIHSGGGVSLRKLTDEEIKKGLLKGAVGLILGGGLPVMTASITAHLAALAVGVAVSATWNPLTWIPAIIGSLGITGGSAVATPVLAFIGGPVAMAAAAVGVAMVPIAWNKSRAKLKADLPSVARDFIAEVFDVIRTVKVRELRKAGELLLREYRLKTEKQITETEATLETIRTQRPTETQLALLAQKREAFQEVMKALPPART